MHENILSTHTKIIRDEQWFIYTRMRAAVGEGGIPQTRWSLIDGGWVPMI